MSGGGFKCWLVSVAVASIYMYILGRNSLRLYRKSNGERFFHSQTKGTSLRILISVLSSLLLVNIIVESGHDIEKLCIDSLSTTIITENGVIVMMTVIILLVGFFLYKALLIAFITGQEVMADKIIQRIRKINPSEARELHFKYLKFKKNT